MQHEMYMRRCFDLAQAARGYVAPNPMVGAVLVHENRIIGSGFHQRYGQVHAEIACLQDVSEQDRMLIPESRMYVSLEPCAHYGQTPPCAERLVQERVRSVIIANEDPFDQVDGRGINLLRENGITVETGVLADAGRWMNRRFFCFHQEQRPYIILKWAQTDDGFMARSDRGRFQISNVHSRQLVHKWRTEEHAIMVGYQTALHDDPQLTARLWNGPQPLRIVLDRNLQLPPDRQIFRPDAPTWIVNAQRDAEEGHLRYLKLSFDDRLLPALLAELHKARRLSLLVEGGASLLQSFVSQGLWDEARVFKSPLMMGEGILSPVLYHGASVMQTPLGEDLLDVQINSRGRFSYVNGMAL